MTHAGAYFVCPDTELVAVCDVDPLRARSFAERWEVPAHYDNIGDMLEAEKADIVSLCSPTHAHGAGLAEVCHAGVPAIFCEKPLSDEVDEAREMVRNARGSIVAVNYLRRWNPSLATLQEELTTGKLGRPLRGVVRYTKGLVNNGSHLIDLARWFFGEPQQIEPLTAISAATGDPGVDFRLGFEGGLEILFQHIPHAGFVFIDVDIVTERSRVVIEQRGQALTRFRVVPDPTYPFKIISPDGNYETGWDQCLSSAVEDIVGCLRNGGQPRCAAEDGLRALEIAARLLEVGRTA